MCYAVGGCSGGFHGNCTNSADAFLRHTHTSRKKAFYSLKHSKCAGAGVMPESQNVCNKEDSPGGRIAHRTDLSLLVRRVCVVFSDLMGDLEHTM